VDRDTAVLGLSEEESADGLGLTGPFRRLQ